MKRVKTYILKHYRFVYASNGKTLDYVNWYPGEPNNHGNGEDCVEIGAGRYPTGQWNDGHCSGNSRPFACQK